MLKSCLVILSFILFAQANPIIEKIPNENLMIGDIVEFNFAPDQMNKGVAQIPNSAYGLWPNGRIPYVFSTDFTATEQTTIKNGMKLIESVTCIRFYPRTSADSIYLNIISGIGCYSSVGRRSTAGPQDVSLQKGGCISPVIAAHEFLHAAGFHHEQSRPDRDSYLTINWNNIDPNKRRNFEIIKNANTLGFAYDYNSIMHYGGTAGSINGLPTLVPKQAGVVLNGKTGRTALSLIDAAEVKTLYKCG